MKPKILQYTDLLHKHGDPKAKEVREFMKKNAKDEAFLRRAKVLNKVFELKNVTV
jgi:hypothetical protein